MLDCLTSEHVIVSELLQAKITDMSLVSCPAGAAPMVAACTCCVLLLLCSFPVSLCAAASLVYQGLLLVSLI